MPDARAVPPPFGAPEHVADVAEHAPVMLHSADAAGVIRWANAAWRAALGYDEADLADGVPVRDVLAAESHGDAASTHSRIRAGERVLIEGTFRTKDGRRLVVVMESEARVTADGTFRWSRSVLRDVTAERGMQYLAREAERRHRVTLEALQDGVAVLSPEGVVQYVNAAATRLLGVTAEQVIGRPLLQLPWKMFSPDGEPRTRESHPALVALRERRAVTDDRMLVLRGEALKDRAPGDAPAPGRLWLEVQAMLLDPADPASPVISAFRDVTADVQARRLQDELLGIVAHELRAPLTSLRGALAMLAGTTREADGPAGTLLPMALRNVERLEALVTDLLDLERIEAGQLPMTLEDVPVQALLDDVTDVHGLVAARDGLTLACPASSLRVRGDAARLQQVVRNLVGNALKFSPPGSTVTVDAVGGPSDTVVLRVTDQGRGIPEDQRERIFERFAQVKREDATRKGGAGLGLSIVRAIVEAHGGRVHIEDGPGGGSRFVVRLPRAE